MLFLNAMYNTISRVIKMLSVKDIPKYKWEGLKYAPISLSWMEDIDMPYTLGHTMHICKGCHQPVDPAWMVNAIPSDNGAINAYYCYRCMSDHVSYCPRCNQPFENPVGIESRKLCHYCAEAVKNETIIP